LNFDIQITNPADHRVLFLRSKSFLDISFLKRKPREIPSRFFFYQLAGIIDGRLGRCLRCVLTTQRFHEHEQTEHQQALTDKDAKGNNVQKVLAGGDWRNGEIEVAD
jgi:hypothetical protein